MYRITKHRWLLPLTLLIVLSVSTVGASGPAASVQLVRVGEMRAGLDGQRVGALSRLQAPATPIRVPAGATLGLEVPVEAVFFQAGTGAAYFDLFVRDANSGMLLDGDTWDVRGSGPAREPGALRVEVTLDTPGEVHLVVEGQVSAWVGSRDACDTREITVTVEVVGTRSEPTTLPLADKGVSPPAPLDQSATSQSGLLATPRVHLFPGGVAAHPFAIADTPTLTAYQGRRTRVEIQPEAVWYGGAGESSVSAALELFLIDTDGMRVPYGQASTVLSGADPGIARRRLFVNPMLTDPGEFQFVARVTTDGPSEARAQVEIPFRLAVEPAPPGQRGYIGGRVVAADTGLPIADVPVRARRADGTGTTYLAHTDAYGRYLIQVLYGGEFIVHAGPSQAGYAEAFYPDAVTPDGAQPVTVQPGRTVKGIDFALEPAGAIAGRVISEETGEAVFRPFVVVGLPGSTLPVAKGPGFEDGTYVTDPLPPGQYWVYVAGTEALEGEYYLDARSIYEADLVTVEACRRTTGVDFALSSRPTGGAYGTITGRVVDQDDGTPLGGMYVYAMRQPGPDFGTAETAPDGTYSISVPPGRYLMSARDPRRNGITEYYAMPVQVRSGEVTAGIDFALPGWPDGPMGAIEGRVYAADQPGLLGRQPLRGVHLDVTPLDATGRAFTRYEFTDASGFYRVGTLEPGRYRVQTVDPIAQFGQTEVEVVVNGNETTAGVDFDLYLVDGPHIGSLSGRITDESTGQPLEGIHVLTYEEEGHQLTYFTTTNADGRYHFDKMRGNHYVQARDPNGRYVAEWWSEHTDSATSRSQATRVQVYDGRDVVGIDLALQPVSP